MKEPEWPICPKRSSAHNNVIADLPVAPKGESTLGIDFAIAMVVAGILPERHCMLPSGVFDRIRLIRHRLAKKSAHVVPVTEKLSSDLSLDRGRFVNYFATVNTIR